MSLDVVVVGEILVELASDVALSDGAPLTLGVSGDALNSAAASAAAGACGSTRGATFTKPERASGQAASTRRASSLPVASQCASMRAFTRASSSALARGATLTDSPLTRPAAAPAGS